MGGGGAQHDVLQPQGETRAGGRVGDTARSEHTVMAPRQGSPTLSPAPECTCALVAVAKASPSSASRGVTNSLQAGTSPSFPGTEAIN